MQVRRLGSEPKQDSFSFRAKTEHISQPNRQVSNIGVFLAHILRSTDDKVVQFVLFGLWTKICPVLAVSLSYLAVSL